MARHGGRRDRRRHRHHGDQGDRLRRRRARRAALRQRPTTRCGSPNRARPCRTRTQVLAAVRGSRPCGRSPSSTASGSRACRSARRCTACWGSTPAAARSPASITWADTRAAAQADRLRDDGPGAGAAAAHRHAGAPDVAAGEADVAARERSPSCTAGPRAGSASRSSCCGRWCGERRVDDHSIASATGLLALDTLDWDDEALDSRRRPARAAAPRRPDDRRCCAACRRRRRRARPARGHAAGRDRRERRPAGQPRASAPCTPARPPARSAPAARCG